jgi:hypothetical protein
LPICIRRTTSFLSEYWHATLRFLLLRPSLRACLLQATNAIAARVLAAPGPSVLGDGAQTLKAAGVKPEESFEIAFNMACAAIAAGELSTAQKYLDAADTRGQEMLLEENASQEVRFNLYCWHVMAIEHGRAVVVSRCNISNVMSEDG